MHSPVLQQRGTHEFDQNTQPCVAAVAELWSLTCMTKRRKIVVAAIIIVVLAAGYFVGWHTWAGLALRGTCKLYIRNDSDTPLRNVRIPVANSLQPAVTSRFDIVRPRQRLKVSVPRSHIYVGRIDWEQGQRTNTFDRPGIKVHMGNIVELVVDSSGKISIVDKN
jgi:hypothetical protein